MSLNISALDRDTHLGGEGFAIIDVLIMVQGDNL
jgi:hypothetical protein